MSSKLLTVFSSLSSTPRCRLLFIFVCEVKFVSVAVSLLTVNSGSLFIFFAPAICFNCLDKVNGLTNVCVAEILWAIFCPCGGTSYYCTFFFFSVAWVLAVTRAFAVFDLGSWANSLPKAWHRGWRNSAQFRVVCVKVPESRCIMAASVWPQSNVRICYMVGAAAPHMAPLMEMGLAGGYAWGTKCSVGMFGQFTLQPGGRSRGGVHELYKYKNIPTLFALNHVSFMLANVWIWMWQKLRRWACSSDQKRTISSASWCWHTRIVYVIQNMLINI